MSIDDYWGVDIEAIRKVKDLDEDVMQNGKQSEIAAELTYMSFENEMALRDQAMRELGLDNDD